MTVDDSPEARVGIEDVRAWLRAHRDPRVVERTPRMNILAGMAIRRPDLAEVVSGQEFRRLCDAVYGPDSGGRFAGFMR